ncbi:MAG: hypothetical protein ACXAC2_25685, partial [Candidatus Kariarchaeaceae archaeon]
MGDEFDPIFLTHPLIFLLSLVPTIMFLQKYRLTKIKDLQYFAILFFCSGLTGFAMVIGKVTDHIIFYQLGNIALNTGFLMIFTIAVRVIYIKTPIPIKFGTLLGYSILIIIIGFWKPFTQP